MKAVTFQGVMNMQVREVADPMLQKNDDIIVRQVCKLIRDPVDKCIDALHDLRVYGLNRGGKLNSGYFVGEPEGDRG